MDDLRDISGTLYGLRLRGRLPATFAPYLRAPREGAGRGADLALGYEELDELRADPAKEPEIWASDTEDGGRFSLFRQPDGFVLEVRDLGRGRFRCASGAIDIEWVAGTGAPHYLFTYALPLWLETRGVPVLHASAVALGPDPGSPAVAFVAPTGTGKSVLCAELLRHGCRFVADDGLALRRGPDGDWRCSPGPPLLRLWPSGLERRLEIAPDSLPRVHETLDKRRLALGERMGRIGTGGAGDLPLAAVYLLDRRPVTPGRSAAGVEVATLGARDALVELLEHGVAAAPAAALGHAASRLDLLSDLARKVPVRRLGYPSGTDTTPEILEALRRQA